MLRSILTAVLLAGLAMALSPTSAAHSLGAPQQSPLSVVDGQLGSCYAEFHVTDAAGKPQYNVPVHVLIRYGFMGKRKTDLQVGTNSDGKARVAGLPDKVRAPLHFEVGTGEAMQVVEHDPAANCHANFDVTAKPGPAGETPALQGATPPR